MSSQDKLLYQLRTRFGQVQIYYFKPGERDNGYAWVGFKDEEAMRKAVDGTVSPKNANEEERQAAPANKPVTARAPHES